ncbi:MAG: hypothetical protein HY899_02285 [Deltaproteobacteria bacterium]|nr:hypothetical protein [Deltaproteobacteria bacterium]
MAQSPLARWNPAASRLRMALMAAVLCLIAARPAQAGLSCVTLSLQKVKLQLGPARGDDRLRVAGEFTLAPPQSIDPGTQAVVVSLLDRGGTVFTAAIAAGTFRADASGRKWRFSDGSGQQARGLTRMSFSSTDGVHFGWKAQGRDLDLSATNELDLEAIVAVGDDCARALEPCNQGRGARTLSCRQPSPDAAAIAEVEVTTRGRTWPLPQVVSIGSLGWDPNAPWTMLEPYAAAAHRGQVRLFTLNPQYFFDQSSTTAPTPAQWQAADDQVRNWAREVQTVVAAGYQPTTQFGGMPRWLSSRPADESVHPAADWAVAWALSPPADLSAWYDLVQRFVAVIASEGLHLSYQVWDEPNWMFYATLDDYFDLYETTAGAIRAADPLALVGGPGLSGYAAAKDSGWSAPQNAPEGEPLFLPAWIAEMGQRGSPIDFVDWHFPTPDPHDGRIDAMVSNVRGWLAAAGYDPAAVQVRIGEWLLEHCGQEAADLPSAGQIVPMLSRFADAGVTWHTHTSFTDQSNWSDGCWTHVGLFSGAAQHPSFLVRAKLNVFRLVSWLGEVRLPVARRDPFVEAIATQSDAGYEVLLANAVSSAAAIRAARRAAGELCATGVLPTSECDEVAACWESTLSRTVVAPSGALQACLEAAVTPEQIALVTTRTNELLAEATARLGAGWSGTVRIAALPSGVYDIERALVDGSHGNVCAYNKATEPAPSADACGAGGAVDQAWAAVEAQADEAARDAMRTRGYSDGEITTIETNLVEPCRAASETSAAFVACVDAGTAALAAQLGRDAGAMTADLHAAFAAYDAARTDAELSAAADLNALPEVTSRLEPVEQATAQDGRLDLQVSLPPDGVMLLRLRRVN